MWTLSKGEAWWEESRGDWTLAWRIVPQGGHAVFGELRVFPTRSETDQEAGEWATNSTSVPRGGLLSKYLTAVPATGELMKARQQLAKRFKTLTPEDWENMRTWQDPADLGHPLLDAGFYDPNRIGVITGAEKRPGRPGRKDKFWLKTAVVYHQGCRSGSRHPIKDVAAAIYGSNGQQVTPSQNKQAAKWVGECRKRGFLTPAPGPGAAGGELTEEAMEMLSELGLDPTQPESFDWT